MFDVFKWKFPIGRMFGITIFVHLAFILVLVPLVLKFSINETVPGRWIDVCTVAAITFLSVLLHEFGHSFGARSVGGESDQIMMWPLGGVAEISFLPATPKAHFVMVLCGPLVNFVLCVFSALTLAFCFEQSIRPVFNFFTFYPFRTTVDNSGSLGYLLTLWNGESYPNHSFGVMLFAWTFYVNFFLFVFNMALVGLPYDGGALVRSVLWRTVGYHTATMYMITTGFIIAAIMLMASIFFSEPLLIGLAIFGFFMCYREWVMLETRSEEFLFGYDFSQGYTSLEKDLPQTPPRKRQNFIQRYLQQRRAKKLQREQEQQDAEERRMDELLEKIQRLGKESLTDEETRFLKRVSDRYRNRH